MKKNYDLTVGPVRVDRVTIDGAADRVMAELRLPRTSPAIIMASNAQFINLACAEPRFAAISRRATLNVADGISVVFASRLLGRPVPGRVVGLDLMLRICEKGASRCLRIFLLGGCDGAADRAARVLAARYPGLVIAGTSRPPMGREFDPDVVAEVRRQIVEAEPDMLVVCFGAPLQEYWIEEFAMDLPLKIVMGNGAAFDVLAGYFRRPPLWIQNIGCEWLYRLAVEPRRLWRRYLLGNLSFINTVWRTWKSEQTASALPQGG
ncbi:MAG TPA: WecB/TagA/CpsF family glycosyltransferase [Bryobacteraceae bacterium]|nr:WecB/TagA/CpsF family glycosyltransferase [Bryobacteraceae bacterium]